MLGSAESEKVRLIVVKLFSQNSNLCDHDTSTSQIDGQTDRQTDRQTDGRTTCHGNTALRVASRGNYFPENQMTKFSAVQFKHSEKMKSCFVGLAVLFCRAVSFTHRRKSILY